MLLTKLQKPSEQGETMTKDEALKLALSTLNEVRQETFHAEKKVWEAIYTIKKVLAQPKQDTWVGLMDEEIDQGLLRTKYAMQTAGAWRDGVEWATKQLQERNT